MKTENRSTRNCLAKACLGLVMFLAFGNALAQTDYEAENAVLGGTANVSTEHAGYSGSGYVQGYDAGDIGASTTFSVTVPSAGWYDVALRYGNGYGASTISVYVNSVKSLVSALPSTGSWTTWSTKTETFQMKSGANTIAYVYDTGDVAMINLDKITVGPTTQVKPDLSVSAILWTPAAPAEGSAIQFKAVVCNGGTGPSPSGEHRVSFQTGGQEIAAATGNTISIPVGGCDTISADATWSSSHGTYTVTAVIDPNNTIPELSETNNSLSKPITLTQLAGPDLTVLSIGWTPSNPPVGATVKFSVTVKNIGLDPTPGIVAVGLTINAVSMSGSSSGAIAAGTSAVVSMNGSWTAANGANIVVATVDPQNLIAEPVETNNTLTQNLVVGRGAQVPWIEYQAEDGILGGGATVVGPSRVYGTPAGEASGRMAVLLGQTNASVSWIATASANSIVIRNCIPDAPAGGGLTAPIGLYINGQHKADITLSSQHSWIYGKDNDPQTDDPSNGQARKIYDESHLLFKDFAINAGDTVMLRKDAADNVAYNYIDFIDLEQVGPPIPMPAGYISITDSSQTWAPAIPDDSIADDNALYMCMTAAQSGKYAGVYIPPGTYIQNQKQQASNVKIQGAGMWYSTIYCPDKSEGDWGTTGFIVSGDNCEFRDFALFGWGGTRTQGGKAFCSNAHKNMVVQRLWIEHVCSSFWVGGPGESTNLQFLDNRIRNTGADGINMCNGCLNCVVNNCHARNTGDDAFAIWSATDLYPHPCTGNVISNCTAELPWRAACFAIYGGENNRILNCIGADAMTYPGLTVSSEFNPYPMQSATVDGVTLSRCGAHYFTGYPYENNFGAIWLRADLTPTDSITVRNVDVIDPGFQGISIQGSGTFTNTLLDNITISNPTTYGIEIMAGASGSATLRNVTMISNQYSVPRLINRSTSFTITDQVTGITRAGISSAVKCGIRSLGSRNVIEFSIPESAQADRMRVSIMLFSINGTKVATIADDYFTVGNHRVVFGRTDAGKRHIATGYYTVVAEISSVRHVWPMFLR
jgi:CARDB/Pectate lyase superfamily protein/Carbohydrate binding module (family 35)